MRSHFVSKTIILIATILGALVLHPRLAMASPYAEVGIINKTPRDLAVSWITVDGFWITFPPGVGAMRSRREGVTAVVADGSARTHPTDSNEPRLRRRRASPYGESEALSSGTGGPQVRPASPRKRAIQRRTASSGHRAPQADVVEGPQYTGRCVAAPVGTVHAYRGSNHFAHRAVPMRVPDEALVELPHRCAVPRVCASRQHLFGPFWAQWPRRRAQDAIEAQYTKRCIAARLGTVHGAR
jgi:hypothetical protein